MESGILVNVVMPICLAIIMFGMGISLRLDDFKRVFVLPKAVALGVFGQIILLPIAGYLFVVLFKLSPEHSVGIMVLVACAGGAVSNLIVYLAKGDLALSVTLTSVSCVVTVITIPFIVNFALAEFMNASEKTLLPIGSTNIRLFVLTLFPVMLGMLVGHFYSKLASRIEAHVTKLSTIFFVAIVLGILIKERNNFVPLLLSAGPVVVSLNVSMMLVGLALAKLFRLNSPQSVTISIEIGVQNSATGIYIASALLHNSEIAAVPAVYSIVMLVSSAVLIGIARKRVTTRASSTSLS